VNRRIGAANDRGVADRRVMAGSVDELARSPLDAGGIIGESDVVEQRLAVAVVECQHPAVGQL